MKKPKYRVKTHFGEISGSMYYLVQKRYFLFWVTIANYFLSLEEAKDFIKNDGVVYQE